MHEELSQKVRGAAVAAWWTVLIGVIWMTAGWFAFVGIMSCRPAWMLNLWGGGPIGWDDYQIMAIWFFGAFKLLLFIAILIAIWLTLWQLRRGK
jgi:hypothetical protein